MGRQEVRLGGEVLIQLTLPCLRRERQKQTDLLKKVGSLFILNQISISNVNGKIIKMFCNFTLV